MFGYRNGFSNELLTIKEKRNQKYRNNFTPSFRYFIVGLNIAKYFSITIQCLMPCHNHSIMKSKTLASNHEMHSFTLRNKRRLFETRNGYSKFAFCYSMQRKKFHIKTPFFFSQKLHLQSGQYCAKIVGKQYFKTCSSMNE